MTPTEQIEHLNWTIAELTTPAPEWAVAVEGLNLSPQMRRIFGLLTRRAGEVVPFTAIQTAANMGTSPDDEPSRKGIDVQLHRLRRKLARGGIRGEIRNVYGAGYVWCPE